MNKFKVLALVLLGFLIAGCNSNNDKNIELLMHNMVVLQASVDKLHEQLAEKGQGSSAQGRLNPDLVNQFSEDESFLEEIIALKKQKIRAELQYEIAQIDDSQSNLSADTNGNLAAQDNRVLEPFDVFTINYSAGSALVKVGDRLQSVYVGDEIGSYKIQKVDNDRVTVVLPNGESKVKRLLLNAGVDDVKIGDPNAANKNRNDDLLSGIGIAE